MLFVLFYLSWSPSPAPLSFQSGLPDLKVAIGRGKIGFRGLEYPTWNVYPLYFVCAVGCAV